MNIDREIAEKIMEWHMDNPKVLPPEWCDKDGFAQAHWNWHPSTDIKQAFEVVEKMRERGFLFQFQNDENGSNHVSFIKLKDKPVIIEHASNKNLAMAICKAALKAMEA